MKREIRKYVNYYRNLRIGMTDYGSVISSSPEGKAFLTRHHSFARSDILEKSWFTEYTDEMYDSVMDCLACYRWYVIPEILREVSGSKEETDLEYLLDNAGYSVSLIAEELFYMIDICLESGQCNEKDLHRIRMAYNGLSGFQDDVVRRIAQWGNVTNHIQSPFREDVYSGYLRRPSIHSSAASIAGVFAG